MTKEERIRRIKKNILDMHYRSQTSHVGSALSCVEILYNIYFERWHEGDKVILSKAHASTALYAVLIEKGLLNSMVVNTYPSDDYPEHCKYQKGIIDYSGGSLGMGLSFAIGLSIAYPDNEIFVVLGDGELEEGNIFEAWNYLKNNMAFHQNISIYVDNNDLQGYPKKNRKINTLKDDKQFMKKFYKTTKGSGVSYMEDKLEWHYKTMTEAQYKTALKDISK